LNDRSKRDTPERSLKTTIGSQYRFVLAILDNIHAHFCTAVQAEAIRINTPVLTK